MNTAEQGRKACQVSTRRECMANQQHLDILRQIERHFTDASKSSPMPHGGVRQVKDYYLSRLACYLTAMNGDPRKPEIAAAQNYFAISTRAHEIHQLREEQEKRLTIRLKVSESFK